MIWVRYRCPGFRAEGGTRLNECKDRNDLWTALDDVVCALNKAGDTTAGSPFRCPNGVTVGPLCVCVLPRSLVDFGRVARS